jgi:hypothetical protein
LLAPSSRSRSRAGGREKWDGHPNLRKRLPKPALGRGRLQRMARRAFLAEGPELTTTAILDWAYVRRRGSPLPLGLYWSLHRALRQIGAVPVERSGGMGRPLIWRLKPEHAGH